MRIDTWRQRLQAALILWIFFTVGLLGPGVLLFGLGRGVDIWTLLALVQVIAPTTAWIAAGFFVVSSIPASIPTIRLCVRLYRFLQGHRNSRRFHLQQAREWMRLARAVHRLRTHPHLSNVLGGSSPSAAPAPAQPLVLSKSATRWKTITRLLSGAVFSVVFLLFVLWNWNFEQAVMHGSPVYTATQTEPLNSHGAIVYISRTDKDWIDGLQVASTLGIPLFVGVTFYCYRRRLL